MAWGLAEFDAEQRGKKQGYSDGIADGIQQGISQGAHEKAIETAKNALSMNIPLEQIVKLTGLSADVIQSLK